MSLPIWLYIIGIFAVCAVLCVMLMSKSSASAKANSANAKYKKKEIVTPRELKFYKELKQICDRNRLTLFTKVRLADILEPKTKKGTSEYTSSFNRIKSKHVDFVLCDSIQLTPLLVIELDDSTHNRSDRQKRDAFLDEAMQSASMPIIHVYDAGKLEEKIKAALGQKQ